MELEVFKAIAAVTKELSHDGITKDRKNQQQGYAFRGIDDVYNTIAPVLAKNNLCVFPSYSNREVVERPAKSGGSLFYVTLMGEYEFVSALDGSRHTVRTFGEAMDSADKATNKAMSAAFKYALMQTFTIPTEGDNDADAQTPQVRGSKEAAQTVASQKLDELARTVPQQAAPPSKPKSTKTSTAFNMLDAFARMKEDLGEKDYYRILGANGYEKSNQILDRETGIRIYKEMGEAVNDLKIKEQSNAVRQ